LPVEKRFRTPVTALNKYDRKILDKYTGFYSNFIESNTAKSDIFDGESFRGKE
jgi:hypothetical protein